MLHCPCNQLPLAKHYLAAFSWREHGSSFPSKQLTRMKEEPGLELNSSGVQLNSTQSSNYGMAPLITLSAYSSLGKTEHCLYNLHRKLIKTCAMHQTELVFHQNPKCWSLVLVFAFWQETICKTELRYMTNYLSKNMYP